MPQPTPSPVPPFEFPVDAFYKGLLQGLWMLLKAGWPYLIVLVVISVFAEGIKRKRYEERIRERVRIEEDERARLRGGKP